MAFHDVMLPACVNHSVQSGAATCAVRMSPSIDLPLCKNHAARRWAVHDGCIEWQRLSMGVTWRADFSALTLFAASSHLSCRHGRIYEYWDCSTDKGRRMFTAFWNGSGRFTRITVHRNMKRYQSRTAHSTDSCTHFLLTYFILTSLLSGSYFTLARGWWYSCTHCSLPFGHYWFEIFFTGRMSFLSPSLQRQRTGGV